MDLWWIPGVLLVVLPQSSSWILMATRGVGQGGDSDAGKKHGEHTSTDARLEVLAREGSGLHGGDGGDLREGPGLHGDGGDLCEGPGLHGGDLRKDLGCTATAAVICAS